jgi:hypothetical protein
MNTTTQTAGQALTAEIRRYFHIGPRTRNYRDGINIKNDMFGAISNALTYPGYYNDRTQAILTTASGAFHSWNKHVEGYRIDGVLAFYLRSLTPYELAAYLGRMVDAGVENVGQGETFFQTEARRIHALAA